MKYEKKILFIKMYHENPYIPYNIVKTFYHVQYELSNFIEKSLNKEKIVNIEVSK